MINETKILANVTSTHDHSLFFYVLGPVVNGEVFYQDDLSNATYVTAASEIIEFSSEQFRNDKAPYYKNKFPQGYFSGRENFYPMKLNAGETKNGLPMIKEQLDAMVTAGLVTYTVADTRKHLEVKTVKTGLAVHGELIALGKTKVVELTDEIQKLIDDNLLLPQITVSGVSPATGAAAGGTSVTITGTGFNDLITSVKFGGVNAASFTVVSSTQITAVTPAHATGTVSVVLSNGAYSATLASGFTYS